MPRCLPALLLASLGLASTAFAATDHHVAKKDAEPARHASLREVLNRPISDTKLFDSRPAKADRSRELHPIRDLERFANKHVRLDPHREVHPIRDLKRFTEKHVQLHDDTRDKPVRRKG